MYYKYEIFKYIYIYIYGQRFYFTIDHIIEFNFRFEYLSIHIYGMYRSHSKTVL